MTDFLSLPPLPPSTNGAGMKNRDADQESDDSPGSGPPLAVPENAEATSSKKRKAQPKWRRRMSPGFRSKKASISKLEMKETQVRNDTGGKMPAPDKGVPIDQKSSSSPSINVSECSPSALGVKKMALETCFGSEEESIALSSQSSSLKSVKRVSYECDSSSKDRSHLNVPSELNCMPGASNLVGSDEEEGASPGLNPASALLLHPNELNGTSSSLRLRRRQVHTINERRRRFEDNLAAIFMGFVLVFLICHFPRLLLNIHELVTIEEAMECTKLSRQGFSLWSLILISISHFLLVLNSSINILIYCFLSSKFREECAGMIRKMSGRNHSTLNNLVI